MSTPKTTLVNPRRYPRFSGISTFARFPLIDEVLSEGKKVDWAVYGAPYDSGVTYRPGARFGPRSIRNESQYVKPYHIEHDLTLSDVYSLADAGDARVEPFDLEANARVITESALEIRADRVFMLGGDHSCTLANLRASYEKAGKPKGGLAMIHFDSHVDTVDVTMNHKYSHASPFIRAVEEGVLDPKRMLSIGVKGPLNTKDDLAYATEHGVELITYEEWRREGTARIDAFLDRLGDDATYLTFDIDCIDPTYAPGTGTPSVGGFTSAEALALVRGLARNGKGPRLVGGDVVEVLPDRDVMGNTALLAAHIAFEILCLSAVGRV
ncbi:MAG: arginase family protein [Phycisphaerales bacterium]